MATNKDKREQRLSQYERFVKSWVRKFDGITALQKKLQMQRRSLEVKSDAAKRISWNRRAATWRKSKERLLERAETKHITIHSAMIDFKMTLPIEEFVSFGKAFSALAIKFKEAHDKLTNRSLTDLCSC